MEHVFARSYRDLSRGTRTAARRGIRRLPGSGLAESGVAAPPRAPLRLIRIHAHQGKDKRARRARCKGAPGLSSVSRVPAPSPPGPKHQRGPAASKHEGEYPFQVVIVVVFYLDLSFLLPGNDPYLRAEYAPQPLFQRSDLWVL